MKHSTNYEVIKCDEGFWINLDKSCCDPLTERGEVVYFTSEKEAWQAVSNDKLFINKMIELSEYSEED